MPRNANRRTAQALAVEPEAKNGMKSLIVLVRTQTRSAQAMVWQLMTSELKASAQYFDEAKAAYLYSIVSVELNPQWLAASNRALLKSSRAIRDYWDNAAQVSRNAHLQRIGAIKARGATALSSGKSYSDILDISHQGYLTRNNINNEGHRRTINSIQITTVIGNHASNEHYTADGNSKYYWVNNDGVYIGTDNPLFDPRSNQVTNRAVWNRFHKE